MRSVQLTRAAVQLIRGAAAAAAARARPVLLSIGCATLVWACNGRTADRGMTIADSAGIRIVTLAPAAAPPSLVYQIDLSIGLEEGEAELLFGDIADVAVDEGGRLFVLDLQSSDVRLFDAYGRFVRRFGRAGRGPGELSRWTPAVLLDSGGRVLVPDPTQRRVTVFDSSGTLLPSLPVTPRPAGQSWALLDDGRFLLRGLTVSRDSAGRFTFHDALLRSTTSDSMRDVALDTLFVFDYPATPIGAPPELRVPLIVNVPFWARLSDGRIAWSSLDRNQVMVHDSSGPLRALLRHAAWQRRRVSAHDADVLRDRLRERLARLGGDIAAADGPNVDPPDSLPAITALLAAPHGQLWVQRMGTADDVDAAAINSSAARTVWLGGTSWDIIDRDYRIIAQARLPRGVRPLRITDAFLVGVAIDSTGVQRVVRLRTAPGRLSVRPTVD